MKISGVEILELWLIRPKGLCRKKVGIESRKSWQWLSSSHDVSIVVLESQVDGFVDTTDKVKERVVWTLREQHPDPCKRAGAATARFVDQMLEETEGEWLWWWEMGSKNGRV